MTEDSPGLIEKLRGSGKYYDAQGRLVENCDYSLEVAQKTHPDGAEFGSDLKNITGELSAAEQLILYSGLPSPLALELEDGRRLNFFIVGLGEDRTAIQGAGDFYTPKKDD